MYRALVKAAGPGVFEAAPFMALFMALLLLSATDFGLYLYSLLEGLGRGNLLVTNHTQYIKLSYTLLMD